MFVGIPVAQKSKTTEKQNLQNKIFKLKNPF